MISPVNITYNVSPPNLSAPSQQGVVVNSAAPSKTDQRLYTLDRVKPPIMPSTASPVHHFPWQGKDPQSPTQWDSRAHFNSSCALSMTGHPARSDGQRSAHPEPPSFLDHHLLLLAVAEEYLVLAQKIHRDPCVQNKLVATALGCFEAILTRLKLQPEDEAQVRLRYAVVLHEQTNDIVELEEVLGQGILLCERHSMFEMKYNMQYLLCQVLYQRNPRASFTLLETTIRTVEAYVHTTWLYAFRFLRVTLSLRSDTYSEMLAAVKQLKLISEEAEKHADKAIFSLSSIIEALLHLRLPASDERREHVQRLIAIAHGQQLDPTIQGTPNLIALMYIVDLSCSLQAMNAIQAIQKLDPIQKILEEQIEQWTEDGTFSLPVHTMSPPPTRGSFGPVRTDNKGAQHLVFRWFPRNMANGLFYLLQGITMGHRNTDAKLKPEECLVTGRQRIENYLDHMDAIGNSPRIAEDDRAWCYLLLYHMRINLIFLLCTRSAWKEARDNLTQLVAEVAPTSKQLSSGFSTYSLYLRGLIHQGTGSLESALSCYQDDALRMKHQDPRQWTLTSPALLELSIFAALNSLLIIRSPSHPMHHLQSSLLASIQPYCSSTSNKSLYIAYNIVLTASQDAERIIDTKQFLQSAINALKTSTNHSLTCVLLAMTSHKFFTGVIGAQAEKSAISSYNQARKACDSLWITVTAGLLADSLQVQGKPQEALKYHQEGLQIAQELPEELQRFEERRDGIQIVI